MKSNKVKKQSKELARMMEDAARYRKLRDWGNELADDTPWAQVLVAETNGGHLAGNVLSGKGLDLFIDSAMWAQERKAQADER